MTFDKVITNIRTVTFFETQRRLR